MCARRVGLTGFVCKCDPDAMFCAAHRYAETHACSFDHKGAQRERLSLSLPRVEAHKMPARL